MKSNRMRPVNLFLAVIVIAFGMGACAPAVSAPAPAPTPTALSAVDACDVSKVEFTGLHWFREPDGAWRVVAMMHNRSDKPIAKVFMDVETRDKNDNSAFPESTDTVHPTGPGGEDYSAYPLNLLPGSEVPFTAWIKREIPNLDHFTIEKDLCVIAEPARRLQLRQRAGQLLVDDNGLAQVIVELNNPSQETALVNGMMAGVFDEAGELITADYAQVTPRILAPGESGPVRATLALPPGAAAKVKSYKLYMDALATEASPRLLDAGKDIQINSQYLDAAGNFHVVGQIDNRGTQPLMVSVQATVYADAAKTMVVDAAFLDTLIPIAPGASLPFDLTDWQVLDHKAGLREGLAKGNVPVTLRVEPFRTWTANASVAPLTVLADPPTVGDKEVIFTGQVRNDTGRTIILGTVTVAFRDNASEKITAIAQTPLDTEYGLPEGQTLSYSVAVPVQAGFDPGTVQFEITASGQGS